MDSQGWEAKGFQWAAGTRGPSSIPRKLLLHPFQFLGPRGKPLSDARPSRPGVRGHLSLEWAAHDMEPPISLCGEISRIAVKNKLTCTLATPRVTVWRCAHVPQFRVSYIGSLHNESNHAPRKEAPRGAEKLDPSEGKSGQSIAAAQASDQSAPTYHAAGFQGWSRKSENKFVW